MTALDLADRHPTRAGDGNGDGWTSLKAWSSAIGLIGIPGTIALYLVYAGATRIPRVEQELQMVRAQQEQILHNQEKLMAAMETMIRVAQRACSNAANDESARQRCFDR